MTTDEQTERQQAIEALAESWASIDGKLNRPDYEMEHMDGYLSDADELLFRLEKRGFTIVRKETI